MEDNKSFNGFYSRLNDIVNTSFNLGENMVESKVVNKILRYLPKKF